MGIICGTPNRTDSLGDANRISLTRLHVQTTRPANELLTWSCPPERPGAFIFDSDEAALAMVRRYLWDKGAIHYVGCV